MKTILTLDTSQIKQYSFCPLSWAYQYKENLRLAGLKTDSIDKGTLVHTLLEYYYKNKAEYSNYWEAADRAITRFKDENKDKDQELLGFLIKRFFGYIGFWGGSDFIPIKKNDVLGVEVGFSKVIFEDENKIFIIEGKIDLITSTSGKLCIIDHKTQDKRSDYYSFRPQMLTYALASDAKYGMINYFGLQKDFDVKDPKRTFRRDTMAFPSWMLARWKEYLIKIFYEIWAHEQIKDRPNELNYTKNLTSCAGAFETHPCQYTALCNDINESDTESIERKKNFSYVKIDPWTPWKLIKEQI